MQSPSRLNYPLRQFWQCVTIVTCQINNIALILVKIPPDSCIKWLGTGVSSLNVELCLNIRDLEKSTTAPY